MNIRKNHQYIPDAKTLHKRLMLCAKLDFLLNQDDETYTIYHYDDKNWLADGDYVRIDDGSGDHLHILMTQNSTVIKGFSHESKLSPYNANRPEWLHQHNFFAGLEGKLKIEILDPALEPECTTFAVWSQPGNEKWQFADFPPACNEPDGSDDLLDAILDINSYSNFLTDYYEIELDRPTLEQLFNGAVFSDKILIKLFPTQDAANLLKLMTEKFKCL